MTATAFPLCWPDTIPRSKVREKGAFKTTLTGAIANVKDSLRLFGTDSRKTLGSEVISSNVTLGENTPADPGVAVWFTWDGLQVCIPVDRYLTVAANLQAIHHILEARRVELRHGTLALVRATFQGFIALPAPSSSRSRPWWVVLDIVGVATSDRVEASYRRLAKERHPDTGGSQEAMAELNRAREEALKEISE